MSLSKKGGGNKLGKVCCQLTTDKQNALRRECTFNIEIVLKIGVAGVNIYLNTTVLSFQMF